MTICAKAGYDRTQRGLEEQIMFLEFLDLEFDPEKKELYLAAHYTPTHRHPDIKDWDFLSL